MINFRLRSHFHNITLYYVVCTKVTNVLFIFIDTRSLFLSLDPNYPANQHRPAINGVVDWWLVDVGVFVGLRISYWTQRNFYRRMRSWISAVIFAHFRHNCVVFMIFMAVFRRCETITIMNDGSSRCRRIKVYNYYCVVGYNNVNLQWNEWNRTEMCPDGPNRPLAPNLAPDWHTRIVIGHRFHWNTFVVTARFAAKYCIRRVQLIF